MSPLDKKRVSADLVFFVDTSARMQTCLDDLIRSVSTFVDTATVPNVDGFVAIHDARWRVIGYSSRDADGDLWRSDSHFLADAGEFKQRLLALQASGSHGASTSLLDALHEVAHWPQAQEGQAPSPLGWRFRYDARRVGVIFTASDCKPTFEAAGRGTGNLFDVAQALSSLKLEIALYAPEAPCYLELSAADRLEWEPIGALDENPARSLQDLVRSSIWTRSVVQSLDRARARVEPPVL